MARLIDADKIVQGMILLSSGTRLSPQNIITLLNSVPIAYDVDKVVEELESIKDKICLSEEDLEIYQSAIDDATEIVKAGGESD